jgi:uncharacterized DUF497 family protein
MYNIHKRRLEFAWNSEKDQENLRKHGVAFGEAATVFLDKRAGLYHDPEHSDAEDRYILHGMSEKARMLVVCHCYRRNDSIIRIISARKADAQESTEYGQE